MSETFRCDICHKHYPMAQFHRVKRRIEKGSISGSISFPLTGEHGQIRFNSGRTIYKTVYFDLCDECYRRYGRNPGRWLMFWGAAAILGVMAWVSLTPQNGPAEDGASPEAQETVADQIGSASEWDSDKLGVLQGTIADLNHSENEHERQEARDSTDSGVPIVNCSTATAVAEITICKNQRLAALNSEYERKYDAVKNELMREDPNEFYSVQDRAHSFLKWRDDCNGSVQCIANAYGEIIRYLSSYPAASTSGSDAAQ